MAIVAEIYGTHKPESTALIRIRRLSLPFELLFGGMAFLVGLMLIGLLVAGLFYTGPYLQINPEGVWVLFDLADRPPDGVTIGSLPVFTRLAGGIAIIVGFGSAAMAFYHLSRLFSLYRHGVVFADQTVGLMRKCGVWLIFSALAPGLMQPLMRAVGSPDQNWFHGHSLAALIVGAALFVLASVIALGREIEHDQKGFI